MFGLRKLAETPQTPPPSADTLSEVIIQMCQYGKPSIWMMNDRTWLASIEMGVTVAGGEFRIRSDFNHPTALKAARQALERAVAAVAVSRAR